MTEPVLAVRGLSKLFGAVCAAENVSLDLYPGEVHALIGPNGAGKSTLVAQIAGALAPDAGSIHLAGEDITRLSVAGRARRGLGRSFQVSSLAMEASALRNVMLGVQGRQDGPRGSCLRFWRPVRDDHRLVEPAMRALTRVGLAERAHVSAAALSHGERRQLDLACALALSPRALLLDEPMAGLGPEGGARITALLHELKAQAPILLIEHDMDAVFSLADRVSVLVYGRIIASGTVDAIRAHPEVREAYLGEDTAC
jgi:branched-chain amino acid transport system ATP-binding protein